MSAGGATDAAPVRGQHVLVHDDDGSWHPGLLASWVRHPDGWWGRVAVVNAGGDLVELEVTAARLRPLTG